MLRLKLNHVSKRGYWSPCQMMLNQLDVIPIGIWLYVLQHVRLPIMPLFNAVIVWNGYYSPQQLCMATRLLCGHMANNTGTVWLHFIYSGQASTIKLFYVSYYRTTLRDIKAEVYAIHILRVLSLELFHLLYRQIIDFDNFVAHKSYYRGG